MRGKPSRLQKIAWLFAGMFLFVYLLGRVPGFTDARGLLFGLFKVTPIVDSGTCSSVSSPVSRPGTLHDTHSSTSGCSASLDHL